MNLELITQLSQLFSFLAVISAIIFGIIQVRQYRIQRRQLAAVELVRSFENPEFTSAFRLIHELPEEITGKELVNRGGEYEEAALILGMKFEAIGFLVYKNIVPIESMEALVGGVSLSLWKRMHSYISLKREEMNQPLYLEWYQWLVEQLQERHRLEQKPAYSG